MPNDFIWQGCLLRMCQKCGLMETFTVGKGKSTRWVELGGGE